MRAGITVESTSRGYNYPVDGLAAGGSKDLRRTYRVARLSAEDEGDLGPRSIVKPPA